MESEDLKPVEYLKKYDFFPSYIDSLRKRGIEELLKPRFVPYMRKKKVKNQ